MRISSKRDDSTIVISSPPRMTSFSIWMSRIVVAGFLVREHGCISWNACQHAGLLAALPISGVVVDVVAVEGRRPSCRRERDRVRDPDLREGALEALDQRHRADRELFLAASQIELRAEQAADPLDRAFAPIRLALRRSTMILI
jgi:hypothetical protein